MDAMAYRRRALAVLGAASHVADELIAFADLKSRPLPERPAGWPLPDEPHVEPWDQYAHAASDRGVLEELRDRFAQFRFPVREGISRDPAYRAATLSGDAGAAASCEPGVILESPATVSLAVWPSIGGSVPVLVAGSRADFETFVRVFTERNEPVPVPASVGAMIVAGLNNWDRIARYRAAWERSADAVPGGWHDEFRRLVPRKDEYQDRLVILSAGPYSDISAEYTGFDSQTWLDLSVAIRREHEFTHYFIYRLCGALRTSVVDELVADFAGLVRALGQYRTDLARRFLGLEGFPRYRAGGRLEYYQRHAPLSPEAFRVLMMQAWLATSQLALVAARWGGPLRRDRTLASVVYALASLSLEDLAAEDLPRRIEHAVEADPPVSVRA